jgi:hypothetical protein
LVIAPSMASHSQSMPCKASYFPRPCLQRVSKIPATVHSWKRRWAELLEQWPVSFRAFHFLLYRGYAVRLSRSRAGSERDCPWQLRACLS